MRGKKIPLGVEPIVGTKRTIKKFLLIPIKLSIGDLDFKQWRWLENAWIEQEWKMCIQTDGFMTWEEGKWKNKRWIDYRRLEEKKND